MFRTITKNVGALSTLVNNAGIGLEGVLATMHAPDNSIVLRVNPEAPILLAKFVCRSLLTQRNERFINISPIIAATGYNGLSVYAASKAEL